MKNKSELHGIINSFVEQLHELWKQEAIVLLGAKPLLGNGRNGVKRTSTDLEQTAAMFAAYVTKNPGLRIEQINKALGLTTKDLALPIRKLLAAKRIKTKGKKRSTTYFPSAKSD